MTDENKLLASQHAQPEIADLHHRVKNTLQNIISYISVMYSSCDTVSITEIEKLVRYIHKLALFYDLVNAELENGGSVDSIQFDNLIHGIVAGYSSHRPLMISELPTDSIEARNALTLCLCFTEIFDIADRFSEGPIRIDCSVRDGAASLNFQSKLVSNLKPERDLNEEKGLMVATALSKQEFGSDLKVEFIGSQFKSSFTCPIRRI